METQARVVGKRRILLTSDDKHNGKVVGKRRIYIGFNINDKRRQTMNPSEYLNHPDTKRRMNERAKAAGEKAFEDALKLEAKGYIKEAEELFQWAVSMVTPIN